LYFVKFLARDKVFHPMCSVRAKLFGQGWCVGRGSRFTQFAESDKNFQNLKLSKLDFVWKFLKRFESESKNFGKKRRVWGWSQSFWYRVTRPRIDTVTTELVQRKAENPMQFFGVKYHDTKPGLELKWN